MTIIWWLSWVKWQKAVVLENFHLARHDSSNMLPWRFVSFFCSGRGFCFSNLNVFWQSLKVTLLRNCVAFKFTNLDSVRYATTIQPGVLLWESLNQPVWQNLRYEIHSYVLSSARTSRFFLAQFINLHLIPPNQPPTGNLKENEAKQLTILKQMCFVRKWGSRSRF